MFWQNRTWNASGSCLATVRACFEGIFNGLGKCLAYLILAPWCPWEPPWPRLPGAPIEILSNISKLVIQRVKVFKPGLILKITWQVNSQLSKGIPPGSHDLSTTVKTISNLGHPGTPSPPKSFKIKWKCSKQQKTSWICPICLGPPGRSPNRGSQGLHKAIKGIMQVISKRLLLVCFIVETFLNRNYEH